MTPKDGFHAGNGLQQGIFLVYSRAYPSPWPRPLGASGHVGVQVSSSSDTKCFSCWVVAGDFMHGWLMTRTCAHVSFIDSIVTYSLTSQVRPRDRHWQHKQTGCKVCQGISYQKQYANCMFNTETPENVLGCFWFIPILHGVQRGSLSPILTRTRHPSRTANVGCGHCRFRWTPKKDPLKDGLKPPNVHDGDS